MQTAQKRNPAGGPGFNRAAVAGLPTNPNDIAARLQRRLSGFALVMDEVRRDVQTMQRITEELRGGFGLADNDRQELDRIALRLFDAAEVLG